MSAKAITLAVQLGSGGFVVAQAVAEALNYRYYDSEVTRQAAFEAGVSPGALATAEYIPSRLERIIMRLGVGGFADTEIGTPSAAEMGTAIRSLESDHYRQFIERVVRTLADQGQAVIVGHAGQVLLQNETGVLKVLIVGSREARAERLAAEEGLTPRKARTLVDQSDRERRDFFRSTYRVDLVNASNYDLVVNSDRLPLDVVSDLVVTAALELPGLFGEATPHGETALSEASEAANAAADQRVDESRTRQQGALRRALESVDNLLAAGPVDTAECAQDLRYALTTLKRVFDRHVREAESPDGSLAEILQLKPHFSRKVRQIKGEHQKIEQELADLVVQLSEQVSSGQVNAAAVKDRTLQAQSALRRHETNGLKLLYDSYLRDEGEP